MAKKSGGMGSVGSWAFLIGVVLAVILGLIGALSATMTWVLVVLGLIVGLLNVTEDEVGSFLMAGAVLVLVSALGQTVMQGVPMLNRVLQALLILFVPATVIVAIKHVFSLARN